MEAALIGNLIYEDGAARIHAPLSEQLLKAIRPGSLGAKGIRQGFDPLSHTKRLCHSETPSVVPTAAAGVDQRQWNATSVAGL